MPAKDRQPRKALETVWIARCPADCPGFEGMYVFAAPNPPRLERTSKKFLVWNQGFTVLPAKIYQRLFEGLRLHPSEGPRRVSLHIKRATSGVWVARYDTGNHINMGRYAFGTNSHPNFSRNRAKVPTWSHELFGMSGLTFLDIFSGMSLPPDHKPVTVLITATALD